MHSDTEEPLVHSQFNLPTYQRRLRHLQSITVRNLVFSNTQDFDVINLQVYFTLHKDSKSEAFYTSEKITGSLNPTWQSFDLQRSDSDTDLTAKFVVVRVWVGVANEFKVKIECHANLSGLVLFSDKLQVSGLKHGPDTLLFGMYNHILCYLDPNDAHPQLLKLVPDIQVPRSETLPGVYMDQSVLIPSYDVKNLQRIHTVLRAIKQTHASVRRIHSTIEDKLVSSSERSDKLSQREALLIRLRQLRQELHWQQQQKQKDEDELLKYESVIDNQGKRLKSRRSTLNDLVTRMDESRQQHIEYREMLVKENAQVLFRRKQLISEIVHYIYPIRKDDVEKHYICQVFLPNAEEYQGIDENMISVSLGYVCHLTMMVSQFLDLPLRYPMIHKGSRSLIIDHVHSKLTEKEREFPLFGKGKEKFNYQYGVFLLNKNISQLRFYCGLVTSDLRQTLSNLKTLLEQKLGFRSLSPSQRGVHPTATASLENSLASQMSLAPSSSTSSFIPHNHNNYHHHHHPGSRTNNSDRLDLSSLEVQRTAVSTEAQDSILVFKNSQQGNVNSNSSGTEVTSTLTSWIESTSKMTSDSQRLNGNMDAKDGSEKRINSHEEDEKEDLFRSREDSFFSSKPKQPSEVLNKVSASGGTNKSKKEIDEEEEEERKRNRTFVSTLSPTPHRSFQLVKPQTKRGEDKSDDRNNAIPMSTPSPPSYSLSSSPTLSPRHPGTNTSPQSGTNNSSFSDTNTKMSTTSTAPQSSTPIRAVSAAVPIPSPSGSRKMAHPPTD